MRFFWGGASRGEPALAGHQIPGPASAGHMPAEQPLARGWGGGKTQLGGGLRPGTSCSLYPSLGAPLAGEDQAWEVPAAARVDGHG